MTPDEVGEGCDAEPKYGDVEWSMKQQGSFEYDNDLPLYDAWATLRQEVERLRAENARLEKLLDVCGSVHGHNVKLKAENAELRERMSQLEAEANAARGQAEVFASEGDQLREQLIAARQPVSRTVRAEVSFDDECPDDANVQDTRDEYNAAEMHDQPKAKWRFTTTQDLHDAARARGEVIDKACEDRFDDGKLFERAAVVKYLRIVASLQSDGFRRTVFEKVATDIEKGEHHK